MNDKLVLVHQQSILESQGEFRALRACLPACFYMVARASGYLEDTDFDTFVDSLDWEKSRSDETGWMRHLLGAELHDKYGVQTMTWPMRSTRTMQDIRATPHVRVEELDWFHENVSSRSVSEVVANGTPVIVTVIPGFGANRFTHAIVLTSLVDGIYTVLDPDARNMKNRYSTIEIEAALAHESGNVSVVVPA